MSAHENEYHGNMVAMLELIWGEGYMAPGGPGNVARLLDRIDTRGKRILDVGCGIGGPALEMAQTHGAEVVGIDLEAPLVERATAAARRRGLDHRCRFQVVEPGQFPFPDNGFDIVLSSGAVTQTTDTAGIIADCYRVLKPGGYFTTYEWMRIDAPYSEEMLRWLRLEELTYVLETIESFAQLFRDAGLERGKFGFRELGQLRGRPSLADRRAVVRLQVAHDVRQLVEMEAREEEPALIGQRWAVPRIDDFRARLRSAFEEASLEAEKAFGNPGLYVEKFIERGRHIEFQFLADSFGSAVGLGGGLLVVGGDEKSAVRHGAGKIKLGSHAVLAGRAQFVLGMREREAGE